MSLTVAVPPLTLPPCGRFGWTAPRAVQAMLGAWPTRNWWRVALGEGRVASSLEICTYIC